MNERITCLVTVHGIGFEQPPQRRSANSGYADLLHAHLKVRLKHLLSDDPQRTRKSPGENGAIYVQSRWGKTTAGTNRQCGMQRLDECLVTNHEPISHIALVYSNLEPRHRRRRNGLILSLMGLSKLLTYSNAWDLTCALLRDGSAMARSLFVRDPPCVSSRPRTDWNMRISRYPATLRSTLLNLEDDVACYVCDNAERERVRGFISEALTRLAARDDVEKIILNAHSNGTVVAFDVLHTLPVAITRKIGVFVTAGSPLRKYVALFGWGNQVQMPYQFANWHNFLDPRDPVANPLLPSLDPCEQTTLFSRLDPFSGRSSPIYVNDHLVNNVHWSAGAGLRAHNYWDNQVQFIPELAELVRNTLTD